MPDYFFRNQEAQVPLYKPITNNKKFNITKGEKPADRHVRKQFIG